MTCWSDDAARVGPKRESNVDRVEGPIDEPQASRPEPEGETSVMRFREVSISIVALGAMTLPALADGPVTVIGQAEPD